VKPHQIILIKFKNVFMLWDLVEITSHISISDQQVVDKIMRTLPPRFDHVVVAIEETKDL